MGYVICSHTSKSCDRLLFDMDDVYFLIDKNKLLNYQQYTAVKYLRDTVVLAFFHRVVGHNVIKLYKSIRQFGNPYLGYSIALFIYLFP